MVGATVSSAAISSVTIRVAVGRPVTVDVDGTGVFIDFCPLVEVSIAEMVAVGMMITGVSCGGLPVVESLQPVNPATIRKSNPQ